MIIDKDYVYVLSCWDNSYYVGSSSNIVRRLTEHRSGKVKYSKSRLPVKLIFLKEFNSYIEAAKFELKVKSWKKRKSIEKMLDKADNIYKQFTTQRS